ncbi:MAG: Beta-lactamase class C-like and penicillin binding proteins (PBPs) superfamily, partial [uncultured Friedmanniella sp.]
MPADDAPQVTDTPPVHDLPRSTPAEQGVASAGVGAFLDAVEAAPDLELHSLMVLRHGHVVAEGWWAPYGPDEAHLLYSLSKSFTATAAGLAAAEGLLSFDEPVVSYFPELADAAVDEGSRSMLVRHVAAMASGHVEDTLDRVVTLDPEEPVRAFLGLAPEQEPGSV